MKVWVVFNL